MVPHSQLYIGIKKGENLFGYKKGIAYCKNSDVDLWKLDVLLIISFNFLNTKWR